MAEWLRRQPAKLMGYARVGSNPTVVVLFFPKKGYSNPYHGRSVLNRVDPNHGYWKRLENSANGVSVTLKLPKL
jgi:hypothetical protein